MADLRITPPLLYTAATILPVACTLVVAARFITRRAQKARFGLDDWLVIPALIGVYGLGITIIIGTAQHALGYPTPKVPPDQVLTAASWQQVATEKCYVSTTLFQTASLTFTKLSVILFYNRIFGSGLRRGVKWILYTAAAAVVLWGPIFFFVFLFTCGTNFGHLWSSSSDALTCPLKLVDIDLSLSITDVIMDFFILIFPIPLILELRMSMIRKIAVLGVFLLGASAIGTSITRLVILKEELSVYVSSSADEDFVATDILYFMHIEASIALIAINLPSLAGFFQIKQMQSLVSGLKSLVTSSSRSSRRSDSDGDSSLKEKRQPSEQSHNTSQDCVYESHIEAQTSDTTTEHPNGIGITVTNTFANTVESRHYSVEGKSSHR